MMTNRFADMRESKDLSELSRKNEISPQANERFQELMNERSADAAQQEAFSQKIEAFFESDEKVHSENFIEKTETEYISNGNIYHTDTYGRIIACEASPRLCEDGKRNVAEQVQSGGEYRREGDQGGHIVARMLGGSEGKENLVPMRAKINQGDYKKMELEIKNALQENKDVTMHVELQYEKESARPSNIKVDYSIDSKNIEIRFDNEQESTELLNTLKDKITDTDYHALAEEIEDMQQDGCPAAITSVKTVFDTDGNTEKVVVGLLDETSGSKTYKTYVAQ